MDVYGCIIRSKRDVKAHMNPTRPRQFIPVAGAPGVWFRLKPAKGGTANLGGTPNGARVIIHLSEQVSSSASGGTGRPGNIAAGAPVLGAYLGQGARVVLAFQGSNLLHPCYRTCVRDAVPQCLHPGCT